MTAPEVFLVYDKQCPACDFYCTLVRIRESAGPLTLINARDGGSIVKEITKAGLDIDQGMVVKMGNQLYYGADAIHMLSLLSTRAGFFNRLNFWLFRSKSLSGILYPLLRSARNLLLKILGRTKINNLRQAGNHRF